MGCKRDVREHKRRVDWTFPQDPRLLLGECSALTADAAVCRDVEVTGFGTGLLVVLFVVVLFVVVVVVVVVVEVVVVVVVVVDVVIRLVEGKNSLSRSPMRADVLGGRGGRVGVFLRVDHPHLLSSSGSVEIMLRVSS